MRREGHIGMIRIMNRSHRSVNVQPLVPTAAARSPPRVSSEPTGADNNPLMDAGCAAPAAHKLDTGITSFIPSTSRCCCRCCCCLPLHTQMRRRLPTGMTSAGRPVRLLARLKLELTALIKLPKSCGRHAADCWLCCQRQPSFMLFAHLTVLVGTRLHPLTLRAQMRSRACQLA